MTIVGNSPDVVIGGFDTHADTHVAAVVNQVGGVLGVESLATTHTGNRQLVSWLERIAEMAATMTRHWIEQSTNQPLAGLR